MNTQELAKAILENVGSEDNISSLVHCVTRLRFILVDNTKSNKRNIENLEGVLSVVESGGQFQVVIGNTVGEVYKEIIKVTNFLNEQKEEQQEVKEKSNIGNKALDLISSIFAPVLSILASVSLLKAILVILVFLNYLSTNSGTYQILHAAEDSALYFMPIFIAYTASKKFRGNELIALTLGAILVHPGIINYISNNIHSNFLGLSVKSIDYSFTFIPIVIAVWLLSKFEKFLSKVMNENLKLFFLPLICLIIMAPLTLVVIGPVATVITNYVGSIYNFIYSLSPIIIGAIVGGFWQVLVIKGIHWGAMPIIINNLSLYGRDTFMALAIPGSMGQGGAVLGVLLKTKNKNVRKAALATIPTGLLGVTEPSIYGITLKYKTPFICASIGGAVGGAIAGYWGSSTMGYIVPGFLTLPVYFGKGFGGLLVAVATSYILSAILSFITFKDNIDSAIQEEKGGNEATILEVLTSPLKGDFIELSQVSDKAFAEEVLGKGVAIIPSEGKLVSPVNGVVTVVFPTGHAVAITSDEGAEILMHIGFNTVSLEGKYFDVKVIQGQNVKKGELLVEFNIEKIKEEGFDITTPIVITNSNKYSDIIALNDGFLNFNKDILILKE